MLTNSSFEEHIFPEEHFENQSPENKWMAKTIEYR